MTIMARADAGSGIVKASVDRLPEKLNAPWRSGGWILEDAVVVDARHLVLVFFVDHEPRITSAGVPGQLTKFTDNEDHAPYRAERLKLAKLRHYRVNHQDLEGARDPMEGRCMIASTLEEMCRRHGAGKMPHGANLVGTEVTYETADTSLIYCTSRSADRLSRHSQWKVASRIHDVRRFALSLAARGAIRIS